VKAIIFERSVPRLAAARVAGALSPGLGSRFGALRLVEQDEPELPGPGWERVRPLLSGICGSDLATVDGHASRWFEPIVSFPFVPGHEVVGATEGGRRVVVEPVLGCMARGVDPPCAACAAGDVGRCERIAFGHLAPGLQTGYCEDTGGGWGESLVAHASQLHDVPEALSDEAAVMVEPTACAVHGALAAGDLSGATVVVLGAGRSGSARSPPCTASRSRARSSSAPSTPHSDGWRASWVRRSSSSRTRSAARCGASPAASWSATGWQGAPTSSSTASAHRSRSPSRWPWSARAAGS